MTTLTLGRNESASTPPKAPGQVAVRRVAVVGQGYVGLPLALRAAGLGHQVIGYDIDEGRACALAAGTSPVEDVSDHHLAGLLSAGAYKPTHLTASLAGFDVAVIAVPTPVAADRTPDLGHVEAAARTLAVHLRPGALVVLESTTYPGTTRRVGRILEAGSGLAAGRDFHLAYSPERIDPGNQVWTLENTPKLVAGIDAASRDAAIGFYRDLVDEVVPVADVETAELAKLLENTTRAVNIALVNELAPFCRDLGVSVWDVVAAAGTKPYGHLAYRPGPGVGGHCLPVDSQYLSWAAGQVSGRRLALVDLACEVNESMPAYVVARLEQALAGRGTALAGAKVLLLGLAYKADTGDVRESPAAAVAALLTAGGAEVWAADPHVPASRRTDPGFAGHRPVTADAETVAAADAVVLLADHAAFDYDLIAENASYVLDCRGRLPLGESVEAL
ncbi:nucleotide sugar dehydrogenase [Streptomyces goshikiensis]|uniref:nucleotide sugar dehydrogenase n=1 Tax=Streptomyces goshikiensis TaxID=1942 RepID=UPI0036868C15